MDEGSLNFEHNLTKNKAILIPSHNVEGLLDFRCRCPYPIYISSTNNILDTALNSIMSSKNAIEIKEKFGSNLRLLITS